MTNPSEVKCPFCDGSDTRLFAAFGSQLSVSTYWCNKCHTSFEKLKWTKRVERESNTADPHQSS